MDQIKYVERLAARGRLKLAKRTERIEKRQNSKTAQKRAAADQQRWLENQALLRAASENHEREIAELEARKMKRVRRAFLWTMLTDEERAEKERLRDLRNTKNADRRVYREFLRQERIRRATAALPPLPY